MDPKTGYLVIFFSKDYVERRSTIQLDGYLWDQVCDATIYSVTLLRVVCIFVLFLPFVPCVPFVLFKSLLTFAPIHFEVCWHIFTRENNVCVLMFFQDACMHRHITGTADQPFKIQSKYILLRIRAQNPQTLSSSYGNVRTRTHTTCIYLNVYIDTQDNMKF